MLQLNLFGQETVKPLVFNPVLVENAANRKPNKLKGDTVKAPIQLPFFDDFSDSKIYPKACLWADSDVYINSSYSDDPISIGVATFDALDKNGMLYKSDTNALFMADKLTTLPIDLSIKHDSLYLSFFYEAGGLSGLIDPPDVNDTLILQFYAPLLKKWNTVWHALDSTASFQTFKRVMVPITDTAYFHSNFRFRFLNYANINQNNEVVGKNSNGNIWNLDYVYLNNNRNFGDTVFRDLAIIRPLYSPLVDYESIPWKHYIQPNVYSTALSNGLKLCIRNNDDTTRGTQRTYIVKYKNSYSLPFGPSSAIQAKPDTIVAFNDTLQEILYSNEVDSATFIIRANLDNTPDYDCKSNDTVYYKQVFKNYYAYDDGSAESGYGFQGEGSANAMLAYKFKGYLSDTLQAVDMFFNRSVKNANNANFYLTVWDNSNSGIPGKILHCNNQYDSVLYKTIPDTTANGINKFQRYKLDTPIIVPDTFYVGWIQNNSDTFLNLGLDLNKITHERIFYNLQGTPDAWVKSAMKGALMIRPVFGKRISDEVKDKQISNKNFVIYPNPAYNKIYIKSSAFAENIKNRICIFDLTGKIMITTALNNNGIDVSGLKPGLYFVRMQSGNGNFFNARFIKNSN